MALLAQYLDGPRCGRSGMSWQVRNFGRGAEQRRLDFGRRSCIDGLMCVGSEFLGRRGAAGERLWSGDWPTWQQMD